MFTSNFSRFHLGAALAIAVLICPAAKAQTIFTGLEGWNWTGTTTASNPYVTVGGSNNSFNIGGEGYSAPISFSTGFGGMGEIGVGGFLAPTLRAKATGFDNEGVYAGVGMMGTYQYQGATSATINYNWAMDAILTHNDPDNGAFIRYRAGLITEADLYSTSYNDFFESGSTVEDSVNFTSSVNGMIDESGTLSFTADPGEVFYLSTLLAPYAGRAGAVSDAFNTVHGSFSVSGGGGGTIVSLNSAIPEPASGSILVLLGLTGLSLRRKI